MKFYRRSYKIVLAIFVLLGNLQGQDLVKDFAKVYKKYLDRSNYCLMIETYQYDSPNATPVKLTEGLLMKDQDFYLSKFRDMTMIKEHDQLLYVDKRQKRLVVVNASSHNYQALSAQQYQVLIDKLAKDSNPQYQRKGNKQIYSFSSKDPTIEKIEIELNANNQLVTKVSYYPKQRNGEENIYKIEMRYLEKKKSQYPKSKYAFANYVQKKGTTWLPIGTYKNYSIHVQ